ncbi:glycosyltransferase [bacterium]|nr:glycosyltransferase [bacterium]
MKDKMTVLFIIDVLFKEGGTEVHLFNLVSGLDPARFQPIVVPLYPAESPMIERMRAAGILVYPLRLKRVYGFSAVRVAYRLISLMRRHKVDIVQTYHFMSDVLGSLTATMAGAPLVICNRRDKGFNERLLHRWVRRLIAPLVDFTICVSDDLRAQLLATERMPADRVVTLYNGVQANPVLSAASRQAKLKELGLSENRPIIGSVMNLRPIKGAKYLVEAAAMVLNKYPEAQFVIVGGAAERLPAMADYIEPIMEFVKQSKMTDSLHFTGNRTDVSELLPLFDIFVLPSLSEGFSNALIEAMRAGNGIVATEVGGNPEALDHGENGLLVPPGDAAALARGLLTLLEDPAFAKQLGERARRKAESRFTVDAMVQDYQRLYRNLSASRKIWSFSD